MVACKLKLFYSMEIQCMKTSFICCLSLIGLVGCGGGGGGNDNPVIAASVNAGADQQVIEKSEFTISAVASPEGGTYTWQRLNGPQLEGIPAEGAELTLTAPDIKADSELLLRVSYQTTDGTLVNDDLAVTITSNNQLPVALVTQTSPEVLPSDYKDIITLSAEQSLDPDENGQIDSYNWQQLAGPTIALDNVNNPTISFSHPLLENNTPLTWQLTVVDDEGGEASTQFTHTLNKTASVIVAKAGNDQQVTELEQVTLDATQTETVTATYKCFWQQLSGELSLDNQQQCITSFIAPSTDAMNTLSFEVTVTDSKGRTDSDIVDVVVNPKALSLINDTAMEQCFNNTQSINCDSPDFPRQDAVVGRDSVADTHLDKVGKGELGFDFTKLNQFADEIADNANDFSCIRDNVTGLIWEVKSPNTGTLPNTQLREGQNHYTWYLNSDGGVQTGSRLGAPNSTCPSNTDCGLQSYVDEVNALDFCNGSNWRVPTYPELLTLLNYGKHGQSLLMDTNYFPNVPTNQTALDGLYYWTSQSAADGISLSQAYIIDISDGNDLAYPKSNTAFVRLVRTAGEQ